MNPYHMTIPAIAQLLLSAHFLRLGDWGLTVSLISLAGLMFTRRLWVRYVVIAVLVWAGYVWAVAMVDFIAVRQALDLPWGRLAAIMGGVILLDFIAFAMMIGSSVSSFFDQEKDTAITRATLFILTVLVLAVARAKVAFPLLLADRYLSGWGWLEIFLLAYYAQWVGGLMLTPKHQFRLRSKIWGLFSLVFFLQLVLGLLGMDRMLMTGTLHLPVPALIAAGPVFRGSGYFMLILFGVTLLLVGPAWCSHLCYIGAWDDFMSRKGGRPTPPRAIRRMTVLGRGTTLVLVISSAWALRESGVPGVHAVLLAAVFGLVGVGIMFFVSRKVGSMVHCTTYCPMGLLANVLGKISPWRLRIGNGCTECGSCFSRCRYSALDAVRVKRGVPALSCTLCGDCVSACAHGHIGYTFPGLSSDNARKAFIVMIVTLHAVFLGVARM